MRGTENCDPLFASDLAGVPWFMTRKCRLCRWTKHPRDFGQDKRTLSGVATVCNDCKRRITERRKSFSGAGYRRSERILRETRGGDDQTKLQTFQKRHKKKRQRGRTKSRAGGSHTVATTAKRVKRSDERHTVAPVICPSMVENPNVALGKDSGRVNDRRSELPRLSDVLAGEGNLKSDAPARFCAHCGNELAGGGNEDPKTPWYFCSCIGEAVGRASEKEVQKLVSKHGLSGLAKALRGGGSKKPPVFKASETNTGV